MSERLLRKHEIAEMLGTTPGIASTMLAKYGAHPIDFGVGRGRGMRWLESAVKRALQAMHTEAQPKPKIATASKHAPQCNVTHLHEMTTDQIYDLTRRQIVQ